MFARAVRDGLLELPETQRLIRWTSRPRNREEVEESGPATAKGVRPRGNADAGGLERRFVPGPSDRLQHGDVLIVLGTDEALSRLKTGDV